MSDFRQRQGRIGEALARRFLERRGLHCLGQNIRTPHGELDLIMTDGEEYVFVEVKLRRSQRFGSPEDALTHAKRLHITHAIQWYCQQHHIATAIRFDLVALVRLDQRILLRHWPNLDLGIAS